MNQLYTFDAEIKKHIIAKHVNYENIRYLNSTILN